MSFQRNATNNDVSSTIDRMISNATPSNNYYANDNSVTLAASTSAVAAPASHGQKSTFIPSKIWKGAREGYYFSTSDQGTGYYLDLHYHSNNSNKRAREEDEDHIGHGNGGNGHSNQRRKVRFGEDEIQTFHKDDAHSYDNDDSSNNHTASVKLTPQQLLEQAEEEQKSKSIKTLDTSRGPTSLKSSILNLEKSISKNQLQRIKYPNDPSKFMESEINLYEEIELWNDLAASVSYYTLFVNMGAVDSLKSLFMHDNVDIVLCVVKLFKELLDPELLMGSSSEGEDDLDLIGQQLCTLLIAFLGWKDKSNINNDNEESASTNSAKHSDNNGLDLVIANLARLNDSEEEERKGIDDIMTLIENLLDLDQLGVLKLASDAIIDSHTGITAREGTDTADENRKTIVSHLTKNTSFTSYLLMKLSDRKLQGWTPGMKLQASEVLATIIQHDDSRINLSDLSKLVPYKSIFDEDMLKESEENNMRQGKTFDGMECLLQAMAAYRKKDPDIDEECEYLENICDAIAASLLNEENVHSFLERQGVELMLRCINERVHSGFCAMKILFFCVSGSSGIYKRAAETFVDAGGLKSVFPIFMGKKSSMPKAATCSDAGNLTLLRKCAQLQKDNRRKENNQQQKRMTKRMKQVLAANREWYQTLESHSIQILYGLTRHLDETSPHDAQSRLASKFVENDCEKCDRLVELALKYDTKMRQAEYDYFKSEEAEEAEESGIDIDFAAMNAKLRGGGELYHRLSAMTGFAAIGSKRSYKHILEQLRIQNSGITTIKAGISEFASIVTDEGNQKKQLMQYLSAI